MRKHRTTDKRSPDHAPEICLAALAAIACLTLAISSLDCRKYTNADEAVECSVSFSPPKEAESAGLWDIFSDSVARLFNFSE